MPAVRLAEELLHRPRPTRRDVGQPFFDRLQRRMVLFVAPHTHHLAKHLPGKQIVRILTAIDFDEAVVLEDRVLLLFSELQFYALILAWSDARGQFPIDQSHTQRRYMPP